MQPKPGVGRPIILQPTIMVSPIPYEPKTWDFRIPEKTVLALIPLSFGTFLGPFASCYWTVAYRVRITTVNFQKELGSLHGTFLGFGQTKKKSQ